MSEYRYVLSFFGLWILRYRSRMDSSNAYIWRFIRQQYTHTHSLWLYRYIIWVLTWVNTFFGQNKSYQTQVLRWWTVLRVVLFTLRLSRYHTENLCLTRYVCVLNGWFGYISVILHVYQHVRQLLYNSIVFSSLLFDTVSFLRTHRFVVLLTESTKI